MGMQFARRTSFSFFLFLITARLFAQAPMAKDRPAGEAPIFEAGGGYVFMSMTSPSTPRVNFNGVNGNALLHFSPRWGATLDLTFARAGNVGGTNHADNVFSALIGPVYYLHDGPKTGVFAHALIGSALVDSAVLITPTTEY